MTFLNLSGRLLEWYLQINHNHLLNPYLLISNDDLTIPFPSVWLLQLEH
jgi:hypothetical protein